MDWVRTRLATRIDLQLHSVEEDVSEWTRLRRSWLKPSSNPTYILTTNLKSFPLSLASFSTSMSANLTALTRVGSITIGRLTLWSSSSSCLCPTRSYFMSGFMLTSMACDKIACCRNCCCIWTKLVLSGWNLRVRGRIFRSSAGSNNEQSCWVFHVLGESCATIISSWTSGMCSTCTARVSVAALNRAPRNALNGITSLYLSDLEWSFLSMTTTCDLSVNIHVARSTSLVTRGSCLSHSKLELHLTYCRWVLRNLREGLFSWYCFAVSKFIDVRGAPLS